MSAVGIYFGPKQISLVESEGKKLLGSVNIPLSAAGESNPDEKVPEQFKIASVLKDELRKNTIETKSADIVLPGKDLIIRTFHMPILSPEELANAVRFEVKKYIPFKVDDLVLDFQIKLDKTARKNFVLFVGMKKEGLDKYLSIFNQLELKVNSVEYAGFGILRLLKLAKVREKGVIALINIDLSQDDEVNFVVLEDGFPLFSRDITLGGDTALDPLQPVRPGASVNFEKLKVELRISLDFYLRKFPTKNIQSVVFMAPDEHRGELETFIKERGLPGRFIDCNKLFDKAVIYSSGFLKAYACSIGKAVRGEVTIDLLPGKARKRGAGGDLFGLSSSLPFLSQIKIDVKAILLGACLIGLPFFIQHYQKLPIEQQLAATRSSRPAVSVAGADGDLTMLQTVSAGYKEKIRVVRKLLDGRLLLTPALDAVPRILGRGLWLSGISFQPEGKGYILLLTGSVYLGDGNKEMETVNKFISDLKNTPQIGQAFGNINVLSMDQGQVDDVILTNFKIACRSS